MATDPLQRVGVFLVFWIGDCIEELAVSPGAADVLWRAASDCFDEARTADMASSAYPRTQTPRVSDGLCAHDRALHYAS